MVPCTFFVLKIYLDKLSGQSYPSAMIDKSVLDDLAKRVSDSIPDGLKFLQDDLEKNLRSALEAGLSHLDLVTREEFDLQTAVLARTREKLEQLEKIVAELEQKPD